MTRVPCLVVVAALTLATAPMAHAQMCPDGTMGCAPGTTAPPTYVPGSGAEPPPPPPVYAPPPEAPPPPPSGTPVFFEAKGGAGYSIASAGQTCTTPCQLYLPPGQAAVTATFSGVTHTEALPIGPSPLRATVSLKRSAFLPALFIGLGAAWLGVGAVGTAYALRAPKSTSASQLTLYRTFAIVGGVGGGVMLISGIVLLVTRGKNTIALAPNGRAALDLAPTLGGAALTVYGRF